MNIDTMQSIGSNPMGIQGRIAGMMMNLVHGRRYTHIIRKHILYGIDTTKRTTILDVGCGGGRVIKIFSSVLKSSIIHGIDHSMEMVRLAGRVNKAGIAGGRVDVVRGSVNTLPYTDEFFNMVTAFDTINFWKEPDVAVNEIKRVLKKEGVFFIVNGYPAPGTKWYEFVKFKRDGEYKAFMAGLGFRDVTAVVENHTIIVRALK